MADATLNLVPNVAGAIGAGVSMDVMGNSSTPGVYTKVGPDSIRLPVVTYDEDFADSPDTEGGKLVRSTPQRTTGGLDLWVHGSTTADMWTQFQLLEQTIEKVRSNRGRLTYTPKNGTSVTYNVETARISDLKQQDILIRAGRMECSVEFQFQPYGELAQIANYPLSDIDPFNRDTLTNQEWRFDNGSGTLNAGGGLLVPTDTSPKALYRPYNAEDGTATYKVTTGASVASFTITVTLKRNVIGTGVLDRLRFVADATNHSLIRDDSGAPTNLITPVANSPAFVANTSYWFQVSIIGSVFTAKRFLTDPNGATPTAAIQTVAFTLGVGAAAKFGAGNKGQPGITLTPQATDWSIGGWRFDTAWLESQEPQVNFEILNAPGSVDGILALSIRDMAGQPRRHVEICLDDRNYDKISPQPTLLDSDVLVPILGSGNTRTGAYNPKASGNSVIRASLVNTSQAICSTGPQQHAGPRKIKTRIYPAGSGPVFARMSFKVGSDGTWQSKDWVPVPQVGNFFEVDLGTILIQDLIVPGQTWEARIEAYSVTNGDTLDVDFVEVLPAKRWGRMKAASNVGVQSLLIAERFNQTSATLTGQVAGSGATQISPVRSPGTVTDDATGSPGALAWTNPGNIVASDNSYATNTLTNSLDGTHWLKAVGFGFAIPAGGTILGVVADVERAQGFVSGGTFVETAKLIKAGTIGGTSKGTGVGVIPGNDTYASMGSTTDLWGNTLTPADVNNANFGIAYGAYLWSGGPATISVDHVRLTIYYSDSAGNVWAAIASSSANDFSVGSGVASRNANSDANINTGRYLNPGPGIFQDVGVAVTVSKADQPVGAGEAYRGGVMARLIDINNYLLAGYDMDLSVSPPTQKIGIWKRVAGTVSPLNSTPFYGSLSGGRRIWLQVDVRGNFWVWAGTPTAPVLMLTGNDTDLISTVATKDSTSNNTAGAAKVFTPQSMAGIVNGSSLYLDSGAARELVTVTAVSATTFTATTVNAHNGTVTPFVITSAALGTGFAGIADAKTAAVNTTVRNYDDYEVWTPDWPQPPIQSNSLVTVNNETAYRPTGAIAPYDGANLLVAPAGKEGRGTQIVVKARCNDVDIQPDDRIADLTRVYANVTPRVALL